MLERQNEKKKNNIKPRKSLKVFVDIFVDIKKPSQCLYIFVICFYYFCYRVGETTNKQTVITEFVDNHITITCTCTKRSNFIK